MVASIFARGLPKFTLKCTIEGCLRLVSDFAGDFGDASGRAFERPRGQLKPPTSMVGFIAGAGIVVRNSIILVDFIEVRLKEGMPLDQAVIDAGAVRFRPMMLTAAAVAAGSAVILFDPVFQGLAIALIAGEIASLALSRMTVPVVYYLVNRRPT
jgi:Cu/Ag efflux pump CusA